MKTLKVMSIIGLVTAGFSFLFLCLFNNVHEYESAIGWGIITVIYLIAFSIVGLVQAKKNQ